MGNCLGTALHVVQEVSEAIQENQQQPEQQQQHQQPQSQGQHYNQTADAFPLHSTLPPGAEKVRVRNVYDGDTLTLTDERRVRLLGIDTPELKQKQPFAEEAKAYTKAKCENHEVWLTFDGDATTDHYGRLLAFVWVAENNSYLCVNEGIVAAGYASVYAPNSSSKTSNYNQMISLQKAARSQRKGMWSNFQDRMVLKTFNGTAYHIRGCKHIEKSRNLVEISESDAMDLGLHACRTCLV